MKDLQLTDSGFQDDLIRELKQTLSSIKLEEKGVYVQASTLGSLEALLEFLRTSKVPVSIHLSFKLSALQALAVNTQLFLLKLLNCNAMKELNFDPCVSALYCSTLVSISALFTRRM